MIETLNINRVAAAQKLNQTMLSILDEQKLKAVEQKSGRFINRFCALGIVYLIFVLTTTF